MIRALSLVVLGFALIVSAAGCGGASGPPGPKLAAGKGTVTLDGKPMPSGEVLFISAGQATAAQVKDGQFSGQFAIGENQVQIFSYREGGQVVEMGGEKFGGGKENFIPAKYNVESKLMANVQASGANDYKFEVTSE